MHVALTTMDKESPEKPIISYGHSNRIAVDDWNGTALENIPTDLIPIIQNYWTIHRRLQDRPRINPNYQNYQFKSSFPSPDADNSTDKWIKSYNPATIAIHPVSGTLFLRDALKSCIQEYTTDGTHLRSLAHIEPPKTHELVIFDNDRNLVAVTDGNVIFYDITSSPEGTLLSQFSFINREIASETINGYPRDIAIDNEGNVLLSDVNSTRVQVYSAKGDFIRSIGMSTTDPKTLKDSKVLISPIGIAIHPTNGNIVVGDSGQIQIFDTHGHVVQVIGGNSIPGSTRDSIDPYGVVVDRDGNIVSHDHADSSIQIFDQEGRYLTDFKILTIGGLKDNASNGPVLHPNGDIIIISYTDSLVFVYGEVPPEPEDLSDWFL